MRAILAVVAGYVIFSGAAVALFQLARVNPHAPVKAGFMAFSLIFGLVFASLGGYIAGWIGRRRDRRCGLVLAVVIALGALSSIVATLRVAAHWSQIAALVLFAPAAWAGDWLRTRILAAPRRPVRS